ncbi:MAG: pyridoxamine 5'-phosphate oxidase family protein [Dehalococcoidia bacterium]
MPGYGIEESAAGLLEWEWAEQRLTESRNYWLSTLSADGAPHAMAVWGIWLDGRLWFSTGGGSKKARNLVADPRCVVTTERADEAVVVEGHAEHMTEVPADVPGIYFEKYGMGYPEDSGVFAVRPTTVFGFIEASEQFASTATRWTFLS